MFLAAVPLGIARRALDEFAAIATKKVRGPATQSIGHDAHAQGQLTQAEGALASARSLLFDTIAQIWDDACRGDEPGLEQRALALLAANQAVRAGVEAVDRVFHLAGAEPSLPTIRFSAASGTFTPPTSTSCSARAGIRPSPKSASASTSPPT